MSDLRQPHGLGEEQWEAIRDAEARLERARAGGDYPLAVGCAKELCEAIAKVVIAERGGIASTAADMPDLVTAAHKLLEYQPGEGIAAGPEVRKVAQGLKSVVLGLNEMRGRYGTGHGRPVLPDITEEHSELACEAAMLWCAWALRRLEPYIAGDVTNLVRDLDRKTFRRGDLAKRLVIANLPRLGLEDQKRLGIAVARRASGGTFVVHEDGIEAVKAEDAERWPRGYVLGLLGGLFFSPNGYLDLADWKVREAARLLAGIRDPRSALAELVQGSDRAVEQYRSTVDDETRKTIADEFLKEADQVPEVARGRWRELGAVLGRPGEQ